MAHAGGDAVYEVKIEPVRARTYFKGDSYQVHAFYERIKHTVAKMEEIVMVLVELEHLGARDVCRLMCVARAFSCLRRDSVWNRLLQSKFRYTRAIPRAYHAYRNRQRHRRRIRSGHEANRRRKHNWYLYKRRPDRTYDDDLPMIRENALRSLWCCKCKLQLAPWIIYDCKNGGEIPKWMECKIRPGERVLASPKLRPKRNPDHLYVWWDGRGDAYFYNPNAFMRRDAVVQQAIAAQAAAIDPRGFRWRVPENANEWLNARGITHGALGVIDEPLRLRKLKPWCTTCYDKRRAANEKYKK